MSTLKGIVNPTNGEIDLISQANYNAPVIDTLTVVAVGGGNIQMGNSIRVQYNYSDQDENPQRNSSVVVTDTADDSVLVSGFVNGNVGLIDLELPSGNSTTIRVTVIASDGQRNSNELVDDVIAFGNTPAILSPDFIVSPQVGTPTSFIGTYFSPNSVAEGNSIVEVFKYDNETGNAGEQSIFSGLASDNWIPTKLSSELVYVSVLYTPVDENGLVGTAVYSTRQLLEPEVYTSISNDSEITFGLDFRSGFNTTDLGSAGYTITTSGSFNHDINKVEGIGGITLDGSNHIEVDFGGSIPTDHSVYILAQFNSVPLPKMFLFGFSDGSGNTSVNFGRNNAGTKYLVRYYDDFSANQAGYTSTIYNLPDSPRLFRLMQTDADSDMFIDGIFVNGEPNLYSGNQISKFVIGDSGGHNQGEFTADVEVAMVALAPYNHSAYNRRALENYLMSL